jgi:hypothetical protein
MPKPWRQVTHISEVEGDRGGWAWVLDLECGHVAVRPQPSRRAGRLTQRLFRKLRFAPKKVRCRVCDDA